MEEIILVLGIIGLVMSVPIVAILTHHQRKMAAIVNFQRRSGLTSEHDNQVSKEIADLREIVAQQAIVLDDLSSMHRRLLERTSEADSIRQRLGS